MTNPKIALYTRVSTSNQEKQETVLTQLSKLKEACKDKTIVKEYTDVCSGSFLSREGLNQLREDSKKGLFDTIYLYAMDRLSRNLGHQIALLEEFEKAGIKIEVLDENYENTPEGMLNRNMRGAFAEYERYKISKRMMDGKLRKLNEGKLIGCRPPYGYKYIKKTDEKENHFEIDLKEAKIVKLIFKLYLQLKSVQKTAEKLFNKGIKARNGKPFHKGTVQKILKNEANVGDFYYGRSYRCEPKYHLKEKRKGHLTGSKLNDKSKWKLIKIPVIIDKITFERVQEVLKNNKHFQPAKYFYLCQGLIKCIHCGRKYTGVSATPSNYRKKGYKNAGEYRVYRCSQKYRGAGSFDEPPCPSRMMSRRKLDNAVWEYVSALINNKDKVKRAIRDLKEKRDKDRAFNQRVYDSLIVEKGEVKKKKKRFLKLYGDENISQKDVDEEISELDSQEKGLDKQIMEAEVELKKIENINAIEEEVEKLTLEYKKKIKNPTPELKKYIVRKWTKEINIFDNGTIRIITKLPELEEACKEKLKIEVRSSSDKVLVAENPLYLPPDPLWKNAPAS